MRTERLLPFLSLFTSLSTLLCCALPALLVSLGLGAVMAGLASNIPGLVWISENKLLVFAVSGALLAANGVWLYANRTAPCPVEPALRAACLSGRRFTRIVFAVSLVVFATGFFFAYLAPLLLG